ncbi:MAG: T9SS type A sorting domain-containing protein [Flavobacteriales bacterium]|nr:T9SS type A sorting domain-containing protein [Flavobacteriales bacterium]
MHARLVMNSTRVVNAWVLRSTQTLFAVNGPASISIGVSYAFWIEEVFGATSYDWSFNDSPWTNTSNDSVNFTILALPTEVCVRAVINGCAGDSVCAIFDFSTDIGSMLDGSFWFTIQPNPSNGTFQVTPTGPTTNTIDIRVFDGLGQLVGSPVILTGTQPQRLDLHEKANGIYFLRATRGSERQVLELVIQR